MSHIGTPPSREPRPGITAQIRVAPLRTDHRRFQAIVWVWNGQVRSVGRVLPGSHPNAYEAWLTGNHAANQMVDRMFDDQRFHGG